MESVRGIGQNPKMPTSPSGALLGRREDTAAGRGRVRSRVVDVTVGGGTSRGKSVGKAVCGWARMRNAIGALAHRVGQGNQLVVLVRVRG